MIIQSTVHSWTILLFLLASIVFSQDGNNWVDGELYTYTRNGAWCWFQDERAVVDTTRNKLIVGSTNSGNSNDVTIFDIKNRRVENTKRFNPLIKWADDHNAPAVMITANGNYLAMWAHHYDEYNHHYSVFSGSTWSNERRFNWNSIPGGTNYTIAYSNLYYLSDEERIYNFTRANDRAPNFIYSDNNGESWEFGGQLTTNSSSSYNKGYYKYWGNGVDRIDMIFTEEHPRDQKTSIYHGYLQDGKTFNTFGEVGDEDIYNRDQIPTFEAFTKVFAHGTPVNGVDMGRCWQSDLVRYNDGTIAILFKARANNSEIDHRNFYTRFNGKEWKTTYIGKAGPKLYNDEQDYTGLAALSPDDPNRIYVSSPFNPGNDDSKAGKREIWRGSTKDNGITWEWEPVTANSSQDNFRPIVPKWKPGKEVVLWFRGSYSTAQNFNTNIVGVIYEYEVGNAKTIHEPHHFSPAFSIDAGSAVSGFITMRYTVPEKSPITLQIFNPAGKVVTTLAQNSFPAGSHQVHFSTSDLPTGVYLYRIRIGNYFRVIKLDMVK